MDPRKKRSRVKLKLALMQLLEVDTLENLSIERVAAAAGVTRPTFYAHFPDMESIINEHVDEWLDLTKQFFVKHEKNRTLLPEQRLALYFEQLFQTVADGDRLLHLAIRGRAGEAALQAIMNRNIALIKIRAQDALDQSLTEEEIYTISVFYGGAMVGVLEAILSKKLNTDYRRLAQNLASFVHRGVGERLGYERQAS